MIIGNKKAVNYLNRVIENSALAHAYIFAGQKGIGKTTLAKKIAGKLLKTEVDKLYLHPNYYEIDTAGAQIKKELVLQMIEKISLSALGGGKKIFVVQDAHLMNKSSANSFLKTLEEPPKETHIFLLAPDISLLMPTIISRACLIKLKPASTDEITEGLNTMGAKGDIRTCAKFSLGMPGLAVQMAFEDSYFLETQKRAEEFCRLFFGKNTEKMYEARKYNVKNPAEARARILANLDFWLFLLRDALMLKYGLLDQVAFLGTSPNLRQKFEKLESNIISGIAERLAKMKALAKNNINLNLMLENLII